MFHLENNYFALGECSILDTTCIPNNYQMITCIYRYEKLKCESPKHTQVHNIKIKSNKVKD
jgi:hypothetical protein